MGSGLSTKGPKSQIDRIDYKIESIESIFPFFDQKRWFRGLGAVPLDPGRNSVHFAGSLASVALTATPFLPEIMLSPCIYIS